MQEKRTRKRLYFLFLARFLQSCFFRFSICLQCEPECHTVVVILAAALLLEGIHNGFYDGKADAASAVFPCSRFVHLEEFHPYLVEILLRDRVPGIENGCLYDIPFFFAADLNRVVVVQMVEGIRQIVGDNLLDFEFIAPDIERVAAGKEHFCLFLADQDVGGLQHAFNHGVQIEPFHIDLILTELELVQVQEFFDHLVHLCRLVDDDIAVELAAFLVVVDVVFQAFRITLNQSDRGFQLMCDICEKLAAHFINLRFFVNIFLQLNVRTFQLGNRLLKLFGHDIEVVSKLADLVFSAAHVAGIEVKGCHFFRNFGQLLHRTDDLAGDDPDHNGTDDDDRNADKEVKLVGKADRIRDALQRASCKVAVSIVKPADDLQILGIGVAVVEFLDLIVVFAVNDFGICLLVSADQAEDQGLEALAVGCVGIDEAAELRSGDNDFQVVGNAELLEGIRDD